jgi:membrane associated rhomboid family serine protease
VSIWTVAVVLALVVVALEIVTVLRRGVSAHRGYFLLLLIDGGLLLYTAREPRFDGGPVGPWPELVAGVVLCGLIVFVPLLLDRLMRRALSGEQVGVAARLASVKELLQPGRAATAERELYAELASVRSGRVDDVVRALRARLVDAEPPEDGPLHDRIITALAFGRRWREAATHYETHVRSEPAYHPGLAIQMVRAYGELGELESGARIVHRLEQAARAHHAGAQVALPQARLFFVAHAGGEAALERVLAAPGFSRLPPRLVEMLRASAKTERAVASPEVEQFATQVADRVVNEARAQAADPMPPPTATRILVAMNVIAFALFLLLLGDFENSDHLIRAGASFHAAVRAGEWWRLWSAMFLHGGVLHIALNMWGLYLLGRILEPLYSWPRLVIIYCVAGLAGNVLSVYNPRPEAIFSLGASGGVMGLLGALLVVLLVKRGVWPEESRRTLVVNVMVLLVAQLGIGVMLKVVDNFAHVGGLVGGAVAALVLLPGGILGKGRFARVVVLLSLAGLTASATASLVRLVGEKVSKTIAVVPHHDEHILGVRLSVPGWTSRDTQPVPDWPGQELITDEMAHLVYSPHLVPLDAPMPAVLQRLADRDKATSLKQAAEDNQETPVFAAAEAPGAPGWSVLALRETVGGAFAGELYYYARPNGDKQAVVVEVNQKAKRISEPSRAELLRVLSTVAVDVN